jgi:hypothetical protein
MWKVIIITALVIYLLIKFSNFIFKIMLSILGGGKAHQQGKKRTKPKDGNVEVEFGPDDNNNGRKKGKRKYDDGEYIEYEEVK